MRNAKIKSCGAYAPAQIIPNSYFNELLQTDVDTWLRENVHIYERRWCAEDESTADLAEAAARQALERAQLEARQLDLIILATDTPEYISPSTAAVLQHRLGASRAGTFDVNTACAGFVTALDIASKYLRADEHYQYVLVIGAYAMSKYLNQADKKTVTLFADGAGALILEASMQKNHGFRGSELRSKGEYNTWMGIYAGGTKHPITPQVLRQHRHQLQFVRRFPPELNPDIWTDMIRTLCTRMNIGVQKIDHFFLTQININSIWETLDRLGVDRQKGHTIMHHYGYTGSACIPMAYNDAWEKGKIQAGDTVFFVGSGGGLAFASASFVI
ncbi:MAG: ketoacyl-ACP synthase III [Bacteroidetes bacterium]|nr:MAG: ketoacyl-ACP synthase III [Bacteroidota bacterium]